MTAPQFDHRVLVDSNAVELLAMLGDRCAALLDVDDVGLMLASAPGELSVVTSSSESMRALGLFELGAREGPCLDAWRTGTPVLNQPLGESKDRWSRFAPEAEDRGYSMVHALPIRFDSEVIGALNLFSRHRRPLPDVAVKVAEAMAEIATFVVRQHRSVLQVQTLNGQLKQALSTRIAVEQAKGIVAEHLGVDMDTSFTHLRGYARSHNRLLADVARDVIAGVLTPTVLLRTDGHGRRDGH